jgi:hypothetical protein
VTLGLLVLACGITPFLGSIGILPMRLTPGTPVWVGVSAGMLFVIAGAMLINGYRHVIQNGLWFAVCAIFEMGALMGSAMALLAVVSAFRKRR